MSKSILVIDSDPKFLKRLNSAARPHDIAVFNELTGKGGLDQAKNKAPDLVILCLEIEDMNGYMVCKRLREADNTAQIPVVIVSAEASEDEFLKNMKFSWRADEYLKKPVGEDKLNKIFKQYLGLQGKGKENEYQDLSEIFAFDDPDLDIKPFPESQTMETPAPKFEEKEASNTDELAEKDRELEYLRKELAAFKPMMKQLGEMEKKNQLLSKELEDKKQELKKFVNEQSLKQGLTDEHKELTQKLAETQKALEQRESRIHEAEQVASQQAQNLSQVIKEKEGLENQLAALQKNQTEGQNKSACLERDLKQALSEAEKAQQELKSLKAKMSENEKVASNRIASAHEELRELESALESARKNNRELENLLKDAREGHENNASEVEALMTQVRQLEKQTERLQEDLSRKEQEHRAAMSSAEVQFARRFSEKEAELNKQIDHLERDKEALQLHLEDANSELVQLKTTHKNQLSEAQEEAQKLQEALDRLSEEFNNRLEELEQQNQTEIDRLKNQLETQDAEWTKDKAKLQTQVEMLQEALDKEKSAHKTTESELKTQLGDLKTSHDKEWENYIKSVTAQKSELKDKIEQLESELHAAQSELAERKGDWENREAQLLASAKQKESAHHQEMELQIKAIESLTSQKETFQGKLSEALNRISNLETEISNLKTQHENERSIWDDTRSAMESDYKEKSQQLEAKLATKANDNDRLEVEIEKLKQIAEEKADLDRQLNRLKLGNDTLKHRLDRAMQVLETGIREIQGTSEELAFEE
ncbi:MAG: response regulator [Acidobacteria bacterium]|nr:response regulator [Acidobacteriota bacterium]MCB9396769.1 response regulator [Acidobacteriota bacterium]